MNLAMFLTRFGKRQELTRYVAYESCKVSYKILARSCKVVKARIDKICMNLATFLTRFGKIMQGS